MSTKKTKNQPKPWLSQLDLLQVNAFKSIYLQHRRLGLTIEMSFAGAVEATSDKIFEQADPKLIERYLITYGGRKTMHRVKNQPSYAGY